MPVNKLVLKELPVKDRLEHWVERSKGRRVLELPCRKIPLNADAGFDFVNTKDKV